MASTAPVRIGFIGAGGIAKVHMRCFGEAGVKTALAGVTDVSRPAAEARAAEFGIEKVYPQVEELLADDHIDAVVIGVPNRFHEPLAVKALEAGKHVLLEKPMAVDAAAAKNIVRAHRKTDRVLMVAHQMRWAWIHQEVARQVAAGALGRIYNAKTGWWRRKGIPGWGSWFTRRSESGGGPLIDIGVHMLDLALYLMGSPKPVSVFGATYAEFGPKKRGLGRWGTTNWEGVYDVEDLGTALIRMEDGAMLSLEVSWAVHMDTASRGFVHLMGSEGGASLSGGEGKLLMEHFDRPMEAALKAPKNDPGARVRMLRHFIDCVRNGQEPLTGPMTGLTNNLILGAVYESSRTGREVELDFSL